jgi:hypothetical protein
MPQENETAFAPSPRSVSSIRVVRLPAFPSAGTAGTSSAGTVPRGGAAIPGLVSGIGRSPVGIVAMGTVLVGGVATASTVGGVLPTLAPTTVAKLLPSGAATVGTAGAFRPKVDYQLGRRPPPAEVDTKRRKRKENKGCTCPAQYASDGSRCGGRASYWRANGDKPTCSGTPSQGAELVLKSGKVEKENLYLLPLGAELIDSEDLKNRLSRW